MKRMRTILKLKLKQLLPSAVMLLLSTIVTPFFSYSQPPPPGGGGNPDNLPLGVPFDWRLNALLILAGIVFSVLVIRKMRKAKVGLNQPIK